MKETTLWDHLRPVAALRGHFQKVSDRFTLGVPDVIGAADGIPHAWELKEFSGIYQMKVKFRPGQLDWLRDWEQNGRGVSWIVSTQGLCVYVHRWQDGEALQRGMHRDEVFERAVLVWEKTPKDRWKDFIELLLLNSSAVYNGRTINKE